MLIIKIMNFFRRNGHEVISSRDFNNEHEILPTECKGTLTSIPPPATLKDGVGEAIKKTQSYYIDQQHDDGSWWYELESNVSITSEYLMLLHYAGLMNADRDKKLASHILRNQR